MYTRNSIASAQKAKIIDLCIKMISKNTKTKNARRGSLTVSDALGDKFIEIIGGFFNRKVFFLVAHYPARATGRKKFSRPQNGGISPLFRRGGKRF